MLSLLLMIPYVLSIYTEDNVVILDDENYTEATKGREAVVLFYHSKCTSSASILLEFKAAASYYPPSDSFFFGMINMYSDIHVPTALKVFSGPKIIYMTSSHQDEFKLEFQASQIMNFVKSRVDPALSVIEKKDLNDFLKPGIVSFILFEEADSPISRKVARSLRFYQPANIAVCPDEDAANDFGLNFKSLYAMNTYHEIVDELKDFSYQAIVDFVIKRDLHKKLPLAHAYDFVIERNLPAVYIFRKESEAQKYNNLINETISQIGDLRVVFGDLNEHIVFSRIIGVTANSQPYIMLIEPVGVTLHKYVPNTNDVSLKNILTLVSDWKGKTAKKYYKQGENIKGELYSGNYEKAIQSSTNDLLVHFYAPWCEHCQKLDNDIKTAMANITNTKVMKMNAEENEVAGHVIEEYPTLKFYSAVTERWFEFKQLKRGFDESTLAERIVDFVKTSRKDRRSAKSLDKSDL